MAFGRVGQPQVQDGRRRLGLLPALQRAPVAHQALVRDVEVGLGRHPLTGRRHQKGVARLAEDLGHRQHLVDAGAGFQRDIADPGQAPHFTAGGVGVGQRLEQPFGDQQAAGCLHRRLAVGQAGQHLVGMAVQRLGHAAHRLGLVVVECQRTVRAAPARPFVPGAHQRVLQDRQLVGVVAHVVEQAVDQWRRQRRAHHRRRAGDRLGDLVAGQPRDQVLAAVDRLGQATKPRAVAQEVRAHRDHDIDVQPGLAAGRQQQLDEGAGVVTGVGTVAGFQAAEQLFELIDQYQQLVGRGQPGFAHRLHQALGAAAQRGLGVAGPVLAVGVVVQHLGLVECAGQVADRVGAGAQIGHAPVTATAGHEAAVQPWQQAGANQRRLAAARRADDGQEARQAQPAQQLDALFVAAEEQVGLVAQEGPQPGVGVVRVGGERVHVSATRPPEGTDASAWGAARKAGVGVSFQTTGAAAART